MISEQRRRKQRGDIILLQLVTKSHVSCLTIIMEFSVVQKFSKGFSQLLKSNFRICEIQLKKLKRKKNQVNRIDAMY